MAVKRKGRNGGTLMAQEKGDPPLPNDGRPKKLPDLDILLAEVLGSDPDDPDAKNEAKEVLKKLIETAKKGNVQAQIAVLDRAYGKPKQAVEHSGPDKGPINIKTWVIDVDGSDTE